MDKEKFLVEGLRRYKLANEICNTYRKELERKLRRILTARDDWGRYLIADKRTIASNSTGSIESPTIKSYMKMKLKNQFFKVNLVVRWKDYKDIPDLVLEVENSLDTVALGWSDISKDQWNGIVSGDIYRYLPDEKIDIADLFNEMIDVFIGFISDACS